MVLKKGGTTLHFDRIIGSGEGYVCGVDIRPHTELIPETAAPTLESGATVDINHLHQILNHWGEETARLTAAAHSLKVDSQLKPCFACKTGNARKKDVAKVTKVIADKLGERLYMDSTSCQHKAYGGGRFWIMAVDDLSGKSWSFFVPAKDEQVDPLFELLLQLKKNGTPCKYIRLDNAGENWSLQESVKNSPELCDIQFEYTPRDSPEYNG
jgi:hypothetical protein